MLTGSGPAPSRTLWMVQQMCNHGTLIEAGKWGTPRAAHRMMGGCLRL